MRDISAEFSFQKRSDFQNLCSTDGVFENICSFYYMLIIGNDSTFPTSMENHEDLKLLLTPPSKKTIDSVLGLYCCEETP